MEEFDIAIDIAQNAQNLSMKELFLQCIRMYFRNPRVPRGDNMGTVSWTWLFDDYIKRHKANPHDAWKPIPEIIYDPKNPDMCLNPDKVWTKPIQELFSYALEFVYDWTAQAMISDKRFEAIVDEKPFFEFQTSMRGQSKKLRYMELLNVPNHGTIVAQTDHSDAEWLLSDLLLRIPAEPDFKNPQRTFSIKLVQDDPIIYLQRLVDNCLGNHH